MDVSPIGKLERVALVPADEGPTHEQLRRSFLTEFFSSSLLAICSQLWNSTFELR
jgi:hypothetical protein